MKLFYLVCLAVLLAACEQRHSQSLEAHATSQSVADIHQHNENGDELKCVNGYVMERLYKRSPGETDPHQYAWVFQDDGSGNGVKLCGQ